MIPILFPPDETAFSSNGYGMLSDCISCSIKESLNSKYEMVLKYPMVGIHADKIEYRSIILAKPAPVTEAQPFRVYRIVPSSSGITTVYARHIAYDLLGIVVEPFTINGVSAAMRGLKQHATTDCPFTFSTDKSTAGFFAVKKPDAIWRLLGGQEGSILDTYGGEYEFRKWSVWLLNRRGADRGVTILYGKNLSTLEQDKNCAEVYTGVYPYWTDGENALVQLDDPIVYAEGEFGFTNILTLDCSEYFEEQPTKEQLQEKANAYIKENNIGVPKVSWKIEFVPLEQTEEYKDFPWLDRVLMGDTVTVVFSSMGVNSSARVVETDYDPITERYNSVTLGSVRSTMAQTIAQQGQQLAGKPSRDWVQSISMLLTSRILGAQGGSVRLLDTDGDGMPDTLYVADNPDPNKAVKVWRWNYEGWAGSKTGYAGPYIMGATLEDGLLATAVTTANLVAGSIKSADNGKTFWLDLDNGILKMDATELTIAGKTVNKIISESMTQEEIFNALTGGGETQGIYLQDGKIYLNAEYIRSGFIESEYVKLNGLFEVRSTSEYNWLGGYIGYMMGSTGSIAPTDGIAMYNPDKDCYFVATDGGIRMQTKNSSLYMLRGGSGVVVDGALNNVLIDDMHYGSTTDSDEKNLEAWLDSKLADMPVYSCENVLIDCYPAISGSTFCAQLYRHPGDYAVLFGFSYNGKTFMKTKTAGTWNATISKSFS